MRDVIFWNIDPDNLNVPPPFLNTTNSLIDVIKECSVIIDEHSNFRVSIGYYTAPVTIQSTGLRIDSFLLAWRRAVEFLSNENDIPLDAVFPFPRFISASINGDFAREDRADPEETKLWRWPESAGWKSAFFEKRYGGEWTDVVAREISHTGSLQDWFLEMSSNTEPGRSLAVVRCILHSAETTEEVTDGLPFLTSVEFESFRNPFLPIKSNGGTIRGT